MTKINLLFLLTITLSPLSFAQSTVTKPEITYEKNWRTGEHKIILSQEFKTRIKTKAMQFDFSGLESNGSHLPAQPELDSDEISLERGVFGVKAGMKIVDAFDVLGVPMSEMALNSTDVLYSFGRNLWLIAKNDNVQVITNQNAWISSTLKSFIAFDDRALGKWKINGAIGPGASKEQVLESLEGEFISNTTFRVKSESDINIEIDFVKDSFSKGSNLVVTEFRYGNLNEKVIIDSEYITNNTKDGYDVIDDILKKNAAESASTLISDLPYFPIFTAYGADKKKIYAYDNHLILVAEDEILKKLYIAETLFNEIEAKADWKLGGLYANQPSEEIAALFEDDVLGVSDYWEVYSDAFKYDFYFKKIDTSLILDELEIEVY